MDQSIELQEGININVKTQNWPIAFDTNVFAATMIQSTNTLRRAWAAGLNKYGTPINIYSDTVGIWNFVVYCIAVGY